MYKKKNLFLQFWLSPIRGGILAELGSKNLHTLCGLAFFINENGECYPSLERLTGILGLRDVSSVSDRITALKEAQWNKKPVLEVVRQKRVKDKDGRYKWGNNHYKINKEILSIFSGWPNGQTEN